MDDIFFSPIIEDLPKHSKMTASCKDTSSSLKPTDAAHSKCRWALSSTLCPPSQLSCCQWNHSRCVSLRNTTFAGLLQASCRAKPKCVDWRWQEEDLCILTLLNNHCIAALSNRPSCRRYLVVLYKPAWFVSLINRFVYTISDWQREEGESTVLEFVLLTAISLCKELALLPSCQINQEFCPPLTGE